MNTNYRAPSVVGLQSTIATKKTDGMYHAVHFCVMQPGKRQEMIRIMVKDGDGFESLQEAINSLPEATDATINDLQRQIAADIGFGFGDHYPEYAIVAKSNNYIFDKPFAEYITTTGEHRVIKHPNADLMVKRVKWNNYV